MKKNQIILLAVIMIVLASVRVLMPEANFNPMGAIALMGGILFGKRVLAYLIPLGALFIGDLLMAGSSPMNSDYLFSTSFLFVYLAFVLIIGLGMLLAKKPTFVNVIGGSLGAAVIFFLVSNFGSWLFFEMYPKTLAGLATCMEAGIPFFRSTLVSQVIFSLGIYVIYSIATRRKLAIA